jgi:hypothetical protein
VLLYALCCTFAGVFAFRLTKHKTAAFAVAAFMALPITGGVDFEILSWFPVADNLLCLCFALAALNALVSYCERGKAWQLAGALGLALAACLSKEWGFVLPAAFGVVAFYGVPREQSKRALIVAAGALACVVVVASIRSHVLLNPHGTVPLGPIPETVIMVRRFIDSPVGGLVYVIENFVAVVKPLIIVAGACFAGRWAWKNRRQNVVLMSALLSLVAFLPLREFGVFGYRAFFVLAFLGLLVVLSGLQILPVLSKTRVKARPQKSPNVLA